MITDKLIDGIIAMQNPTCVGLDTLFDYLPDDMKAGAKTFEDVAERVLAFNKKIIDSVYDIVPSVKVQIAYYEMYGAAGMKAYYETLKYAAVVFGSLPMILLYPFLQRFYINGMVMGSVKE